MSRNTRTARAFTLIELLVVIAIIAILASILFPVFAKAREKARQTSCLANTKQLSAAFLMYVQDFDEAFPGSGGAGATGVCESAGGTSWVLTQRIDRTTKDCPPNALPVPNGSIYSYTKNEQIYRCVSDAFAEEKTLSYSMNEGLGDQAISVIDQPARVPLLIDEASGDGSGLNDGHFEMPDPSNPAIGDAPSTRHNEGANFAFADGHSKWHRPEQVKKEWYAPGYRGD
jgi:prepilin-type N-terminal cleavage/methylation domain-containing protein/prepilin-type processing-associated H-X9-DG protein